MSNVKEGEDKDENKENTVTFEVLQLIKEAQSQHGLKHGDYHRYRGYCSRRLRRLRKSLGIIQSSGTRHRSTFAMKKITNDMVVGSLKAKKDPIRYLYIPLMSAERCWSYAMALKQEANTEPRKRFHLIRKLRKAVIYGQELEKLTNQEPNFCDAKTKLETQAYSAYLSGLYYFETEQWAKASEYLKKAQAIYVKLCGVVVDDETSVWYQQKVDELKPTLRYCAFNIGEQGIKAQDFIDTLKLESNDIEDELLSSKLDQLILQTRERQSATLSEVTWLGKTFAIKQEKIRSFLITYQEYNSVDFKTMNKLEKLLFECRDCIQLLRDANQDKTPLHCYLLYLRLDLTHRRNLFLINNIDNPSDLIRPYEVLLGTLNDMKTLPLRQYFNSEDDIEELLNEINNRSIAFKALRCYSIAKVGKIDWKQAIALLNKSSQYCSEYLESDHKDEALKQQIKELQAKANSEKFNIYANSLIKDTEAVKVDKNQKVKTPVIERLDTYLPETEVTSGYIIMAHFPPQFRPIPNKPLFFDIAHNHLKFPSLETEIANQKSSGLTGLVKGWLWRK
ncbi:signal recognition particle subunit SRP68 [Tetranychus urticae]|uniref:Signal recognition particle subunit SRP68 n=1 Tax=Tetranychus urticae TaxID=32264 RepID=T1KYZ1_TETUR|nr:signal recognition particle subunit SRP68 [Tetranychus urticae]